MVGQGEKAVPKVEKGGAVGGLGRGPFSDGQGLVAVFGGGPATRGADDLDVELRADPHGVGVDQLFDDVGAVVLPISEDHEGACWNSSTPLNSALAGQARGLPPQLLNEFLGVLVRGPVARLVPLLRASSLVQVVEAVAAFRVLADGGLADGQSDSRVLARVRLG